MSHLPLIIPRDFGTLVYRDLRRLAHERLGRRPGAHSLHTTALVHEAWLRLGEDGGDRRAERSYFFAAAGEAMRRVLVDHVRRRRASKRGGDRRRVPLSAAGVVELARADELIALDAALDRLAGLDPRKARVVELRHFAGLTVKETAAALDVSARTVVSEWTFARAWLHRELTG